MTKVGETSFLFLKHWDERACFDWSFPVHRGSGVHSGTEEEEKRG